MPRVALVPPFEEACSKILQSDKQTFSKINVIHLLAPPCTKYYVSVNKQKMMIYLVVKSVLRAMIHRTKYI